MLVNSLPKLPSHLLPLITFECIIRLKEAAACLHLSSGLVLDSNLPLPDYALSMFSMVTGLSNIHTNVLWISIVSVLAAEIATPQPILPRVDDIVVEHGLRALFHSPLHLLQMLIVESSDPDP